MECPSSPSREMVERSQLRYRENLYKSIMCQESQHAASKQWSRLSRFRLEASKLQSILEDSLPKIRKRVMGIHSDFKSVEAKVNRLEMIRLGSDWMSPERALSPAINTKSPTKLTYYSPNQSYDEGFASGSDSSSLSPSPGSHTPPQQAKLVDFFRRRKLVTIKLATIWERLNSEKREVEEIFKNNITILRYKRAEKCLIKLITLQSRLKNLEKELEGLEERLFLEDSRYADF